MSKFHIVLDIEEDQVSEFIEKFKPHIPRINYNETFYLRTTEVNDVYSKTSRIKHKIVKTKVINYIIRHGQQPTKTLYNRCGKGMYGYRHFARFLTKLAILGDLDVKLIQQNSSKVNIWSV